MNVKEIAKNAEDAANAAAIGAGGKIDLMIKIIREETDCGWTEPAVEDLEGIKKNMENVRKKDKDGVIHGAENIFKNGYRENYYFHAAAVMA